MSTGKVVLGTLAGLAIGAIAGILFAPEKGSVTRKQIMDKGDDLVDKRFIHKDGRLVFTRLAVSHVRKPDGSRRPWRRHPARAAPRRRSR